MAKPNLPKQLLKELEPELAKMLATLRELVALESPTHSKELADRCCEFLAAEWEKRNTSVEILPQERRGGHIRATHQPTGSSDKKQLLVLGHYDTVYGAGTLESMPFRVEGSKAYGPGIFDMKAGIVQALFALEALERTGTPLARPIVFLWTSDEEVGSQTSREIIETEARRSEAVFVLEPSYGAKGALKTARKGVGEARLHVKGRASHAGLAPQQGVNAIHELAAQIVRMEKWNDYRRGVTISADVMSGGTQTNVIAERASATLDLRAWTLADMRALEKKLHALRPVHKGAKLELVGGFDRPPMERKKNATLFAKAQGLGAQMGLKLAETAVGGGSDGNFTAALGVPTLDGMGAVGDGAHSADEHIYVKAMPQRAALLAALLVSV